MESIAANGVALFFDPKEREAGVTIKIACEQSLKTINDSWGLEPPEDCRVFIMTSWPGCVFLGAPPGTKILLGLTMPLWYSEFKKRWENAGGWAQRYGKRQVVGIKTPRLIAITPETIGESIFIQEEDLNYKVLSIVCHELTHACSSHLGLPTWLHEGLAMVTVDRCLGRTTVQKNTLQLLMESDQATRGEEKIDLRNQSKAEIILIYVRGYWLTRYLAETQPYLMKSLLNQHVSHQTLEENLASSLGIRTENFWVEIDDQVVAHFKQELPGKSPVG